MAESVPAAATRRLAVGNQVSFENGFAPVVKKDLPAVVNIASSKIVHPNTTLIPFFSDPCSGNSSVINSDNPVLLKRGNTVWDLVLSSGRMATFSPIITW